MNTSNSSTTPKDFTSDQIAELAGRVSQVRDVLGSTLHAETFAGRREWALMVLGGVVAELGGQSRVTEGEVASTPPVPPKIALLKRREKTRRKVSPGDWQEYESVMAEISEALAPYRAGVDAEGVGFDYDLDPVLTALHADVRAASGEIYKALDLGNVEMAEFRTIRATERGLEFIEFMNAYSYAR